MKVKKVRVLPAGERCSSRHVGLCAPCGATLDEWCPCICCVTCRRRLEIEAPRTYWASKELIRLDDVYNELILRPPIAEASTQTKSRRRDAATQTEEQRPIGMSSSAKRRRRRALLLAGAYMAGCRAVGAVAITHAMTEPVRELDPAESRPGSGQSRARW